MERPFFAASRGIVDAEERRKRKALSALQGRKAQAAARLLLALCARAGEGRRRVLVELYSALACHPAADGVSNNTRRPGARFVCMCLLEWLLVKMHARE